MPRKLTAAEHLQGYLADVAARKMEIGVRRRIPCGDGLYLFITGPRSCRWRYDYRHRGVLTSAFWPAIGAAALGEKEAKAERSKLWLAKLRGTPAGPTGPPRGAPTDSPWLHPGRACACPPNSRDTGTERAGS